MRLLAAVALLAVLACGGTSPTATERPAASPSPVSFPVSLPPPSLHPSYPPVTLADVVALGQQGLARRFIGAEGQNLGLCSRGWERIYEPPNLAPRQRAADLVRFALQKQLLTRSCGGLVFGTTDDRYCNCYHGENGYLEVDRGPAEEPAPGEMLIVFEMTDAHPSPEDWTITAGAPVQ